MPHSLSVGPGFESTARPTVQTHLRSIRMANSFLRMAHFQLKMRPFTDITHSKNKANYVTTTDNEHPPHACIVPFGLLPKLDAVEIHCNAGLTPYPIRLDRNG